MPLLCAVKNIYKVSKFAKAIRLSIVKATLVIFTLSSGAQKVAERMW